MCCFVELKEQYAKEHAIIKTDNDGNVAIPFSREEFENFHKVYIKYNNEIKALITKIYNELKQEMKAFKEGMDAIDGRLTQVEANQLPFPVIVEAVIAAIYERFFRFIAWVVRIVLKYGCLTIGAAIFLVLIAFAVLLLAMYGTGKYW